MQQIGNNDDEGPIREQMCFEQESDVCDIRDLLDFAQRLIQHGRLVWVGEDVFPNTGGFLTFVKSTGFLCRGSGAFTKSAGS